MDYSKFVRNITVKSGKPWVRWVVGLETPFTPNVRWVGPDGREINSNVNKYELEHKKLNRNQIQGGNVRRRVNQSQIDEKFPDYYYCCLLIHTWHRMTENNNYSIQHSIPC